MGAEMKTREFGEHANKIWCLLGLERCVLESVHELSNLSSKRTNFSVA
jgi:hypothetical protein